VTPPEAAAQVLPRLDGAVLGAEAIAPFLGLLLSIAFMPLIAPKFWHRHYGKVVIGWALLALAPTIASQGWDVAFRELLHVTLLDYVPFVILLASLYTITGGIRIGGRLAGTPGANTATLAIGTVLAGFMGTTGASMLLVRPILQANEHRRHKAHVFIFLIFLVANIGGALSPLGDPPLFLGFLRGVDFFWPTMHLFLPTVLVAGVLLACFYVLDLVLFRRETVGHAEREVSGGEGQLTARGLINFVFLGGVILAVMMSGRVDLLPAVELAGFHVDLDGALRDVILIGLCIASLRFTEPGVRAGNGFEWQPMIEVALIFAGIFATIVAPLAILRSGTDGALGGMMALLNDGNQPVDHMFFWMTGVLSSFLDNAPTYLAFFTAAGGDPHQLMGPFATTLAAISAGAVYMGAMTYIGNAPNFMVKSIVESQGVRMPSFLGYMGWSIVFLVPVFLLVTLLFFA
jgi:Na+/H+ antiporter NhaD/arsenite permease-like protein